MQLDTQKVQRAVYWEFKVQLLCSNYSQAQVVLNASSDRPDLPQIQGDFYAMYRRSRSLYDQIPENSVKSRFEVYYFIFCGERNGRGVEIDRIEGYNNLVDADNQEDSVIALFLWLDLILNRIVIGSFSVIVGFIFCLVNYQNPDKKNRRMLQNLTSIISSYILVTGILYYNFSPFKTSFNALIGWLFVFGALFVG